MRRKVDVSSNVDDSLRQYISTINNGLFTKGDLMKARDMAIIHYITCERNKRLGTHTQFTTEKIQLKREKAARLLEQVTKWLMDEPYRYESLEKVSERHLIEAIQHIELVEDKRTIKGRIGLLGVCGLKRITHFHPYQYELPTKLISVGELR